MTRTARAFLVLAALLAAVAPVLAQRPTQGDLDAAPDSQAEFGEVRDFTFTERRGAEVSKESLAGEPWIAGFIFTRCSTICPALSQELSQAALALEGAPAKVVAFSVDPEHDTPEVLSEYASHFEGGDSEDWLFLTGSEARVHALILGSFKLNVGRMEGEDPGLAFAHSSRLVVVDGEGRIRGYYDSLEPGGTEAAIARARYLAGVPEPTPFLPRLNAIFNSTAAVMLVLGLLAIKAGRRERHERFMKLAFLASVAFMASYLYYHFVVIPAQGGPVRFGGEGTARVAYLVLLATHVVGAVVNLPMVLGTFYLAHKERWEAHKRLARWTFPLWMYVSVTGVMVYFALYEL